MTMFEGLKKWMRQFRGQYDPALDTYRSPYDVPHDPQVQSEVIIGYRGWRYDPLKKRLTGCYYRSEWPVREAFENVHGGNHHPAWVADQCEGFPEKCLSCGIHAYKNESSLDSAIMKDTTFVLGRVALWGQIVEHEEGWRASKAYPQVLYFSQKLGNRDTIMELCNAYGIDAVPMPSELEEKTWLYWESVKRSADAAHTRYHQGD